MKLFERMLIAGVGLIGGSLGLAARRTGLVGEVVGFGRGRENLETALRRGAVDRWSQSAAEAAAGADLVVLAVPVSSLAAAAEALLPRAARDAVVIDVGSVKSGPTAALEALVEAPAAFVGCHPIAGTEHSGAANAEPALFDGRLCIVTPTPRTDPRALDRVRRLWEGVGMRVETMAPEVHDRLLARISHLPHVVAWSLVAAVEAERVDGRDPLAYSGGALRDTTRVASSHPDTWRDIFLGNRAELLAALGGFERALGRLRGLVESGDGEALRRELERLRLARQRLRS
jgi:prephenate dehydrogenase